MKKYISIIFILFSVKIFAQIGNEKNETALQKPCAGRIERIADFSSKYVEKRNIDVWLPANYDGKKKFSVLYMHDGQMIFDPTNTWNKQSWDVDDTATKLIQEGKIKDVVIVGIWNAGSRRYANYFPQKPFESLTKTEIDTVQVQLQQKGRVTENFHPASDDYLRFLVEELKPLIDKKYAVKTDRKNTFIAGSSMGALISMYAICEYPQVFGGAACISTHWTGLFRNENNPIPNAFLTYLKEKLPLLKKNKLYFDCGDQTLDALYPPIQGKVDDLMIANGFTSKHWKTSIFPGKDHSEKSWKERFDTPLLFLLGK